MAPPAPVDEQAKFLAEYRDVIEQAANKFGLDREVLTALLIQEGSGRAEWGIFARIMEDSVEAFGYNETVGIGQMDPDLAQELREKYYLDDITSTNPMRNQLAFNDVTGIKLAAARLYDLKTKFGLTDEQTFTAYAASDTGIKAWLSRTDQARRDYPLMFQREAGFAGRLAQARTLWR